jgi:SAM-dependent methyltransferase
MVSDLVEGEIEHSRKIALAGEAVWNWSSASGQERLKRRVGVFKSAIDGPNKREVWEVLELGCGTGLFTQELVSCPVNITAIDVSEELLKIASERVTAKNVTFLTVDAHNMPFFRGDFDAVVGSSVLHHLDVPVALRECCRVLRPGGTITFTEPNMLNPQVWVMINVKCLKHIWHVSPTERAFFSWKLRAQLREAGFTDIRVTPFDFVHPSIPGWLLPYVKPFLNWLERIPIIRHFSASFIISAKKGEKK